MRAICFHQLLSTQKGAFTRRFFAQDASLQTSVNSKIQGPPKKVLIKFARDLEPKRFSFEHKGVFESVIPRYNCLRLTKDPNAELIRNFERLEDGEEYELVPVTNNDHAQQFNEYMASDSKIVGEEICRAASQDYAQKYKCTVRLTPNYFQDDADGKQLYQVNGVLELGDEAIVLIEAKKTLTREKVEGHLARIEKWIANPPSIYKNRRVFGCVGGARISDDVVQFALSHGLPVIKLTGGRFTTAFPASV